MGLGLGLGLGLALTSDEPRFGGPPLRRGVFCASSSGGRMWRESSWISSEPSLIRGRLG